ncbi:KH domain-containing protein [Candidatus Dependentiae bacterium]|nr:KH domain-containing protein [Candidatus Dependentiae bacterium]
MSKHIIEFFVKKMVDSKDEVSVSETQSDGKHIFQLHVSSKDLARIIGKNGKTFKALRALVTLLGSKDSDLVLDTAK